MNSSSPEQMLYKLGEQFSPFVLNGLILRDPSSPEGVVKGGTVSLVDTGSRALLVTCAHVYDYFSDYRKSNPNALFVLAGGRGNNPVDITSAKLIDIERKSVDIAVLEPTSGFDPRSLDADFFQASTWPPPRPQTGDLGFFIGYPGIHRKPSNRGLEIRSMPFNDFISSVSSRHLVFADEEGDRTVYIYIEGLKKYGSIGGVSGSAVYSFGKTESLISTCTLVGFVYEATSGVSSTILCHHADFIGNDGKIDRRKFLP